MARLIVAGIFCLFSLNLQGGKVPLLPDVIGYIFLLLFFMYWEEKEEDIRVMDLSRTKMLCGVMILLSAVDFWINTQGISISNIYIVILKGTLGAFLFYLCWKAVADGFEELERKQDVNLKSDGLQKALLGATLAKVFTLTSLIYGGFLIGIGVLAIWVTGIIFLICLIRSERCYAKHREEMKK